MNPEVLTYPKDKNPHIPIDPHTGGAPPAERSHTMELGSEDKEDILPIAPDTTLPKNFYDLVSPLDIRYQRDRERAERLSQLEVLACVASTPEAEAVLRRAYHYFSTSLIEGDYLKYAFEAKAEPPPSEEAYHKFFEQFCVASVAEAQALNAKLYGVPADIRDIAFDDITSCHEVLTFLREIGLTEISSSAQVREMLETEGFFTVMGEERLRLLEEIAPNLLESILTQRANETAFRYVGDRKKAAELVDAVTNRKRQASDCVDGNSFGFYSNTGTIVDPAYLFNSNYFPLLDEPLIAPRATWQTVLHMMGGTYTFGHDHTYLYRNRFADIPNSYIGTPPDYGVVRPGNFVFHDFKYVEYSQIRKNYPLDYFLQYIINHYVDQTDILTLEDPSLMPEDADLVICKKTEEGYFATPLEKVSHVLPFRALKKTPDSDEYYEYDKSCYLAELVDMAMQCDLIAEKADHPSQPQTIGDIVIGQHTTELIKQLWLRRKYDDEVATIIEQVLFMHGKHATEGVQSIKNAVEQPGSEQAFRQRLELLAVQHTYNEYGLPDKPKRPLTCYFEWFMRHARPVTQEEMDLRGLPRRKKVTFISKGDL